MPTPPIQLDFDFDSGSLDLPNCRVEGNRVVLAGRDNFNTGHWKWLYFRATGVAGRGPVFEIADNFETDPARLDFHRMVFRENGGPWRYFDENRRDAEAGVYTFHHREPFTADMVTIAYTLPCPLEQVMHDVSRWTAHADAHPTPSGEGDFVLGRTVGGVDDCGRSIPSHPIPGFEITNRDATGPKRTVVLMAGVHPNESLASHTLAGTLDWLLGEAPEAVSLRAAARTLVYPMANPDGRFAGYNRSTVQHPDRDANRYWREDLCGDTAEINTLVHALLRDTEKDVDYFIDYHSWTDTAGHFGILSRNDGFHRDPFWKALRRYEVSLGESDSGWANPSTETFAFQTLGARFAMTLETMSVPGEGIDRYHGLGANVGRALHRAIVAE